MVIDAVGSNLEIGRAHARSALHLKQDLQRWVASALETYPADHPLTQGRLDEVVTVWEQLTPATLDQVEGMAQVYDVPARGLLTAGLSTYFRSLDRSSGTTDGCTTLGLPAPRPLLLKNRDNEPRFLPMQTVLRVRPEQGHPWLALSTAGAPGVHSSGMNSQGLAIADTHVPSRDVGPGMPRFATMMHVLERCTTTDEAIELILGTPQMGLGNLTVVDADGHTAVVECGFSESAVVRDADPHHAGERPGALVATNHYVSAFLASCLFEPEQGTPGVDSRSRRFSVVADLRRWDEESPPGPAELRVLAGSHIRASGPSGPADSDPGPGSLCQHREGGRAETISTTVYDPVARTLDLCLGRPCRDPFVRIGFEGPPEPVTDVPA